MARTLIIWIWLTACEAEAPPEPAPELWSDEAEQIFQQEAVLRYQLEQAKSYEFAD